MAKDPIQVVYIAGESRSGSTLLEHTLGQIDGFRATGELRYLWERGLVNNERCGCGAEFGRCFFWQNALQEGFGEVDSHLGPQVLALQQAVDHPRSVFRNAFFSPKRLTPAFKRKRDEYQQQLVKLYRGIQEADECRFIIDSSKVPSHGMLLAGIKDIRLHVIHLVRDCRAVAFSMQRRKARPEVTDAGSDLPTHLPTYPAWRTAVRWVLTNRACQWFDRPCAGYTLLRYEDFIDNPRQTVEALLGALKADDAKLDFIDGKVVSLQANHTVAGNPGRFATGEIELVRDEQWQRDMPRRQERNVTFLAKRYLRKYGYLQK